MTYPIYTQKKCLHQNLSFGSVYSNILYQYSLTAMVPITDN
jgi:hypothetical protein